MAVSTVLDEDKPELVEALTVYLTPQAVDLLEQLEALGIFGIDAAEIAGRFIDKALIELLERQSKYLDLKLRGRNE